MARLYKFLLLPCFLVLLCGRCPGAGFFSYDFDLRYGYSETTGSGLNLEAAGLTARKIFPDKNGDRVVLFGFLDIMDNFSEIMLDQAYVLYKGPLGKWNITLGRYRLPFGLMKDYETKRILIKTAELDTVGMDSDNGIMVNGYRGNFDYSVAASQGVGTGRWDDRGDGALFTARLGLGQDSGEQALGLSGIIGSVFTQSALYKKLISVDFTKYAGLAIWRLEAVLGNEEDRPLVSMFLGSNYALSSKAELNFAYRHFYNGLADRVNSLCSGITLSSWGFQFRAALKYFFTGGDGNEISLQVYRKFNINI